LESNKITQIAAGHQHSLFLTEEGQVFAAGSNAKSQLGLVDLD